MTQNKAKSLINVARASLNPAKAVVMVNKVGRRFFDNRGTLNTEQNNNWLRANALPMDRFLEQFDPQLRAECDHFSDWLDGYANNVLSKIPYSLGGGGGVPLLYLLTRLRKPQVIIETGVAAGFSSATFLAALKQNGTGKLYSSDFPYFRLPNPERYVGVVVEESLKANWSLFLAGDDANLPAIMNKIEKIDLFHYDSDKSYQGRVRAMKTIQPKLAPDALIVMDDIQDNSYFHDLVKKKPGTPFQVLEYRNKYIGIFGKI